jgi:ADP-ribose pyrophosphatase YjhB (NUDIX family)
MTNLKWLEWIKTMQAISQIGLTYTKDVYDRERYEQLRELSVEIMSAYTDQPVEKTRMLFANETGYATPKVDVRAVVLQENRLLLVKERAEGEWSLPGGWADVGFSPGEVAVKEVKEESGFDVKAERLLAVLDRGKHEHPPLPYHVYKIFIHCKLVGGVAATGIETDAVGFFPVDDLPQLSQDRNTTAQVELMFELARNPNSQTVFD